MEARIQELIDEIERVHNVRVIFACESGSRAWGFHSPDSDYDVRFIYVHKKDWYLSINNDRDFIELPKDPVLDITGFELRKMLRLFRGSNAKIYEWIQSPVFYRRDDHFLNKLRAMVPGYFSPKAGLHHYLGLTKNTFNNHLQSDQVKLKKYFYALRPVLAALWIAERGTCPPMEFKELRSQIKREEADKHIESLLGKKVSVGEGFMIPPEISLNEFISETMKQCEKRASSLEGKTGDLENLNQLFRSTIEKYDHTGA